MTHFENMTANGRLKDYICPRCNRVGSLYHKNNGEICAGCGTAITIIPCGKGDRYRPSYPGAKNIPFNDLNAIKKKELSDKITKI